ncbi:hypothetical protein MKW98_027407, partial [Papaver atlanticum]
RKESPNGEVDRPVFYMATHVYKNIPDDPLHPKHVSPKKLVSFVDFLSFIIWILMLVSSVGGSEIYHYIGYVRGMGGEVSKTEILASIATREQLGIEKLKSQCLQTQLNTLE